MKVKHTYDLPRLRVSQKDKYHVVSDGLVLSTHYSVAAALRFIGTRKLWKVYKQTAPECGQVVVGTGLVYVGDVDTLKHTVA